MTTPTYQPWYLTKPEYADLIEPSNHPVHQSDVFVNVLAIDKEGKAGLYPHRVVVMSEHGIDRLTKEYKAEKLGDKRFLLIPKDDLDRAKLSVWPSTTYMHHQTGRNRSVNMCGYNATSDFVKIFGCYFTDDDREWYAEHPNVDFDGLPLQFTPNVLQGLVSVWGLRITRMTMQPGVLMQAPLKQWMHLLGTNPMALADGKTSNAEFAELTGQSLATVESKYRFDYTAAILRPSVSCGIIQGATHVQTGSGGGHATYNAPRAKRKGAVMSFQFGREKDLPWTEEQLKIVGLMGAEHEAKDEPAKVEPPKTMQVVMGYDVGPKYQAPPAFPVSQGASQTHSSSSLGAHVGKSTPLGPANAQNQYCNFCSTRAKTPNDGFACKPCRDFFTHRYVCVECKQPLPSAVDRVESITSDRISVLCKCGASQYVAKADNPTVRAALAALFAPSRQHRDVTDWSMLVTAQLAKSTSAKKDDEFELSSGWMD